MRPAIVLTGTLAVLASACGGGGAVTPSHAPSPRAVAPVPLVTTELEVVSGAATLHVWSRGGGADSPVLVLSNGGPGLSHHSMDPLQDALASPTLRVLTYDQRGVGRSTVPGTDVFQPAEYVADLEAIRAHLGGDRVHLLGHSFGGMISLSYLDAHPQHVASIILVSTGVSDPTAMAAGGALFGERVAALQRAGVIPDPIPSATCREKFLALLPAYSADPRFPVPDVMRRRECDDTGRSNVLFPFIAVPYTNGVATSRAPALVLVGDAEPFGPGASQYAVSAMREAHAELVTLPQCGHLAWLECPDPFLARVREFLARAE